MAAEGGAVRSRAAEARRAHLPTAQRDGRRCHRSGRGRRGGAAAGRVRARVFGSQADTPVPDLRSRRPPDRRRRAAARGWTALADRDGALRPDRLARRSRDQQRGVPGAGTLVAAAGAARWGVAGALRQVAAARQIDGGGCTARIEPARADSAGSGARWGVRPAGVGSHGRGACRFGARSAGPAADLARPARPRRCP